MRKMAAEIGPSLLGGLLFASAGVGTFELSDWAMRTWLGLSLHQANLAATAMASAAASALLSLVLRGYKRSLFARFTAAERRLIRQFEIALQQGRIVPFFQPVINAATGAVSGAEVLVRWLRPDGRHIAPADFIGIIERSGAITRLTRTIAEAAIREAAAWRASGNDISISINLSALDLREPDLARHLADLCLFHGLPPNRLLVELTETQAVENLHQAREILTQMRDFGIGVLLDDFGTGYASMGLLHDLPFRGLKIDQRFVRTALSDPTAAAIVKVSIELGRQLGLWLIAEGVEDAETSIWLESQGVHRQQGFLFSPALPVDELIAISHRFAVNNNLSQIHTGK